MASKGKQKRFKAQLQRGGTGLVEMRRLLREFAEHGDLERLKEQAWQENLLGKTSDHLIKDLLAAFKRRFLQPLDLPPVKLVALAERSTLIDASKEQILFPYFIRSDTLAETCYRELVLPRVNSPSAALSRDEVVNYLKMLGKSHPELTKWSDYLQLRWARGFLALLRHFGLMERHPRTNLRRLWPLLEPFTFFWLWYWERGGTFWEAEINDLWPLLQLNEQTKQEFLEEGQLRGWWAYRRLGKIVEFQPQFKSTEEWLNHELA